MTDSAVSAPDKVAAPPTGCGHLTFPDPARHEPLHADERLESPGGR